MRALLLLLVACCLATADAHAEKRVALVIGNSAYEKVARLPNPANDAALMAATLKSAGFDSVDLSQDLKVGDMRRTLRDFIDKAREADIAVIYYAGHGIEVDGTNYLVPVDAVLQRDVDIYDEALSLDRVMVTVEPARQLRLVILDACRDNPFARSMKRTLASRAVGRGLAKIETTSPNTLIAFASKAGSTASDGDGKNSPFTHALSKHVTKPGLDLRKAFGYVRDDVLKATGRRQEPYVYGSLGGDDVPLVAAKAVAAGPQADPQAAVRRDYELALQLGTRDGWQAFVAQYPEGFYANLARGQLKKIAAEETRNAAVEKARLAEQEKARLAVEGARQSELAKAGAALKAAEQARIAAERVKQFEQEKAAASERARLAEQEKARIVAEKTKQAAQEKSAVGKPEQIAAFTPQPGKSEQPAADLPRALQTELRRVGCNTGAVDGSWNDASQKALDLFNKHSGLKLDAKTASADALEAVKAKAGRICPLICETGYRADGDRCLKIVCRKGYELSNDDTCVKIEVRKPTAKREEPKQKREPSGRAKVETTPAKPQASGQIVCDRDGCRPVAKGCRLEFGVGSAFTLGRTGNREVCN
ncbi:MAG: caspase family protein [Bradyrhizobium sp.]|uniref:caspase family protein n=1 Tax=Bradyrhizobium sp. TaxID=376 RepID=UPI002A3176E4|nr:caspase family protein [Bradyrhizobium sp.]